MTTRAFTIQRPSDLYAEPSDIAEGLVAIHIPGWLEPGMHAAMTPERAIALARELHAAAFAIRVQGKARPKPATVIIIPQKGTAA